MPAKSAKQLKLMQAVANNPKFAKKVNIPQSVGKEYSKESKMYNKKMMNGGKVKKMKEGGKVEGPAKSAKYAAMKGAAFGSPEVRKKLKEEIITAAKKVKSKLGMKKGGKVKRNTSKMNSLEELGRVDAEKAYTKKGKRNLKSEKKRVVSEVKRGYKKGGMIDKEGRALALARTGGSNAPMNAKGKMADARGRAMKAGGKVSGKSSSSASKRADGIAQRGRTRGQMR